MYGDRFEPSPSLRFSSSVPASDMQGYRPMSQNFLRATRPWRHVRSVLRVISITGFLTLCVFAIVWAVRTVRRAAPSLSNWYPWRATGAAPDANESIASATTQQQPPIQDIEYGRGAMTEEEALRLAIKRAAELKAKRQASRAASEMEPDRVTQEADQLAYERARDETTRTYLKNVLASYMDEDDEDADEGAKDEATTASQDGAQ